MQSHTAGSRSNLTTAQVLMLLQGSPHAEIAFGADVLDLALNKKGTVDLLGGSIRRSFYANIHGTCDLEFDGDIDWGNDLVRPWMSMADAGIEARWDLGVYSMTTPQGDFGENPRRRQVQGYDRLYLLSREIGATHVAPAGAKVLDEVRRIITMAGLSGVLLDSSKENVTLGAPMLWPLVRRVSDELPAYDRTEPQRDGIENAVTYLRVANDLLFSIGYRGLYADPALGYFRSEPYIQPSAQNIAHVFDFDHPKNSIIDSRRTLREDRFKAPNHWVFVRQNMPGNPPPEPTEGNGGVYIVDKTDTDTRSLTWSTQIALDVADYASLVSQGDNRVAKDMRVQAEISVSTGPFPAAGHGDIYRYYDADMGKNVKVLETEFTLNLSGTNMSRTWQVVA